MALSQDDVRDISQYAQIALTDDELSDMTTYMNEAVDMLSPILDYDLDGVDPTFHPIGDLSNVMRPDQITPGLDLDTALHNAGSTRERLFRVPSILGDGGVE
jgi:aspartyl-tRNA(Asn)/glutamyl-tRNA(Gln) amidotransferase subunit C